VGAADGSGQAAATTTASQEGEPTSKSGKQLQSQPHLGCLAGCGWQQHDGGGSLLQGEGSLGGGSHQLSSQMGQARAGSSLSRAKGSPQASQEREHPLTLSSSMGSKTTRTQ